MRRFEKYLAATGVSIDEMACVAKSQDGFQFIVWPYDKPQFPPHFHVYFVNVKPTRGNTVATVKITSKCPAHKGELEIALRLSHGASVSNIRDAVWGWLKADPMVRWQKIKILWNAQNPQNEVL